MIEKLKILSLSLREDPLFVEHEQGIGYVKLGEKYGYVRLACEGVPLRHEIRCSVSNKQRSTSPLDLYAMKLKPWLANEQANAARRSSIPNHYLKVILTCYGSSTNLCQGPMGPTVCQRF